MMRFDILLYGGFDELDALAPYEVLHSAAAAGAEFSVRLVTSPDMRTVTASHGSSIAPHARLDRAAPPNALVVPGGGWVGRAPVGARAEAERGEIPALLTDFHARGVILASVCTGAMLLAAAGLLRDRPVITHHSAIDDLAAAGANVVRARVVDAGSIVTAGGVTSGLDLALWLTERFASATIAAEVERRMEYERRGTVWRERLPRE